MDFRAEDQRIHVLGRTTTAAQSCHVVNPRRSATLEASVFRAERRSYAFIRPDGQSLRIFRFGFQRGKDPDDRFLEFR